MDNPDASIMKSHIRPPSQIKLDSGLADLSEAQANSRIKPPSKVPAVSKLNAGTSSLRMPKEIDVPRKTLAQRAGEPARSNIAPPPARSATVKGTSLISSRAGSVSSRASTRSNSTRNTSTSSYGSNASNMSRPTSYSGRPQTSMSNYGSARYGGPQYKRPATSMDDHSDPGGGPQEGKRSAWNDADMEARLKKYDDMFADMKETMAATASEDQSLKDQINHYKLRLLEAETKTASLETRNSALETRVTVLDQQVISQQTEVDAARQRISNIQAAADDDMRAARRKIDEVMDDHRREANQLRKEMTEEVDRIKRSYQREALDEIERLGQKHRLEMQELERQSDQRLREEETKRIREVEEVRSKIAEQEQNLDAAVGNKDQEIKSLTEQLASVRLDLENEKTLKQSVQNALTASASSVVNLEAKVLSLKDRIQFLESGSKAQSDRFELMEKQLHDALEAEKVSKTKLIKEETLRRILFNQVQELKGNIRVMCRVRPTSPDTKVAELKYPDLDKEAKELELIGPEERSALGTVSRKTSAFSFDRVFGPSDQNEDVFGEISQLVQSALDGYNVCIFAYGQTGAGKTHTMSSKDGMIPRATHMIYQQAEALKEKGWNYVMEGSFVEVYNEEIHDLLGAPRDLDKTKHEIKHDDKKKTTTVTNLKTVELDSVDSVDGILKRADANRSVAATKSNERSSRSHSVFILKLVGRNSATGEVSEGTLNLVDLAGSERLKQSGAEGDRMKETQNINKSLSCLGDVIGALGSGKEGAHIPYRNSKLTYLLQYSLGGNSKTLMFVMVSPLEEHLKETLTSLKFATKVHNTHIGTAKKRKISD